MPSSKRDVLKGLRVAELLYLLLVALSFYLLFMSRSGEVYTVWEVIHPAFIPIFFVTTFLLLATIFSSEKVEYKLLLVIIHSILSHTLFIIVFPAGYFGPQQTILGETRLVFDNIVFHGHGWPRENILEQIYVWGRGDNFQIALSVILARMLGVDVYWVHLPLVPVLWGIFVPIAAFKVMKTLGGNNNISVFSSLLITTFPTSIWWGTYSVPNTVAYIFFFYSMYFMLKYLSTSEPKTFFLMVMFCFISFLSHNLTGVMSFSLLLVAVVFKSLKNLKEESPVAAKSSLFLSILLGISLLPFALVSRRIFYPEYTRFGLDKLNGLSITDTTSLLIAGEYVNFDLNGALIYGIGPLIALAGMIYYLRSVKRKPNRNHRASALFLLTAFLMVLVDYRIIRLFMVNVPFEEERLWMFRDFIAVPFVTIIIYNLITFLRKKTSNKPIKTRLQSLTIPSDNANLRVIAVYILIIVSLSGWITTSLYYAYPHYGPLQTTSYELEAVSYIDKTTRDRNETYVVICDQWATYAGYMFVGMKNPQAYFFSHVDPRGLALFIQMKENPSRDVMVEAMKINNATVAYFIIEEPRLGAEEYNRIIQQAQQNKLQTYPGGIFYYRDEEKLRIFYHEKSID